MKVLPLYVGIAKSYEDWRHILGEEVGLGVTGQMRSDHSNRVCCVANRNYGSNSGHILIMVAMAATQLN